MTLYLTDYLFFDNIYLVSSYYAYFHHYHLNMEYYVVRAFYKSHIIYNAKGFEQPHNSNGDEIQTLTQLPQSR